MNSPASFFRPGSGSGQVTEDGVNESRKWLTLKNVGVFFFFFKGLQGWRGRWERGSEWGTRVNQWLILVNVWQKPLQYCKVISLQLIKINEKKEKNIKGFSTLNRARREGGGGRSLSYGCLIACGLQNPNLMPTGSQKL